MPVSSISDRSGEADVVGRVAVMLAAFVVAVVAVSYAIFFVALAVGGDDAISDSWVGFLAAVALVGGLTVSLAAWVLAIVARTRRGHWTTLWLPLCVFPALLALVVLAELFVVE